MALREHFVCKRNLGKKKRRPVRGGGPTMLDDMFTCRGGEDLGGGTLDVRCEPGVGRVKSLNATARLLERAMPTAVPASS